jgi:hypothetical protein
MENYTKPTFTQQEIEKFEKVIDIQIAKGNNQITLPTGIVSDQIQRFATYLGFHYPDGVFSPNPYYRNYKVAKNGKKYTKSENW